MISSELPEVLRMSHRILVMCEGRVMNCARPTPRRKRSCSRRSASRPYCPESDADTLTRSCPTIRIPFRPSRRRHAAGASSLKSRFFNPAARQKLLAFASLVLLIVFFSVASPNFLEVDNLAILQATAVNGVLAVACTYVIITPGTTCRSAH